MKAVHFGAGSIGRGFVGDLLHDSGYEVVFLDINDDLLAAINATHSYEFRLIEDGYRVKTIDNVRGVSSRLAPKQAIEEIATADLITTSVWADNLRHIAPLLAAGLAARNSRKAKRVNVIAAENAMRNSELLRAEILNTGVLTETDLDTSAAFPNTAVDRLVLESEKNGHHVLDVGRDHELVIDKMALADPNIEPIAGAIYSDDVIAYIERKLYIINSGHSWAGYVGHLRGFEIMQDVLGDGELRGEMREAMRESAAVIHERYGFDTDSLDKYIDFAINRFRTPGVTDTVSRVCRSPIRKLGSDERFVGPASKAVELGIPYARLARGIAAILKYDDPEDPQSVELLAEVASAGPAVTLTHRSGLTPDSLLHRAVLDAYESAE